MSKQENKKHVDLAEVEEQVLSSTEQFVDKNKTLLLGGVSVIILVVLAVLAFRNFYITPQQEAAANELYKAENYFAVDSFALALEGDDLECVGFEAVADEYGMTKSGKLAKAYAGICYFKLGDYESAVEMLAAYSGDDVNFAAAVKQCLGDAYVELGELKKAVAAFEAVADMDHALFSPQSLKKAGVVYEELGNMDDALEMYEAIKEEYPQSAEASDIDKYIAGLEI